MDSHLRGNDPVHQTSFFEFCNSLFHPNDLRNSTISYKIFGRVMKPF